MQIELSDFIRTRKLDHQLCMSRQTHPIWRMIWVDCSTLYVLDTIISWKLKCVSGISWNAEQREKFAWENWGPLWSLLMQRGHLQPSLRAGGLESYCRTAQVSTLQLCSCNVIADTSAPTDGTAVAAGSLILIEYCFGALYLLTANIVTFHFTSCWFL